MLTHIDPIIKKVIEDLKKSNPPLGNEFENITLERAMEFRDRPTPTTDVEIASASEHIQKIMDRVDHWYDAYQGKVWDKAKSERPSLVKAILSNMDRIDEEFGRWKIGKSSWSDVHKRISDYGDSWRKLSIEFSK